MNRLETFLAQLDSLVVFMAAAHEEIFETIKAHTSTWFVEAQSPKLPEAFEAYRVTVSNAAFLLGYAYFESFLADLAREIFLRRPGMLPPDKQLTFREALAATSPDALLRLLIEKEIRSVFYGPIEEVQGYFVGKLQLPWPDEPDLVPASRLRNCLMHNGGLVDDRAAAASGRTLGSPIRLEPAEVHDLGFAARRLSRGLWNEAEPRHLGAG